MSRFDNSAKFHVPIRPYSPIDSLNMRAAALGSPRYADGAAHADYNGHQVTVAYNDYRRYYTAEYFWAGRIVLARGSFADCLRAALAEQARGAKGASVVVYVDRELEDTAASIALCEATLELVAGELPREMPEWYTWRHTCAAEAARDYAHPHSAVMVFDWTLMQAAESREAYEAAVREKHGRVYQ